jgi:hypothetical protein
MLVTDTIKKQYVLRRNRQLKNVISSHLLVSGKEGNMPGAVSGVAEGCHVFHSHVCMCYNYSVSCLSCFTDYPIDHTVL